MAQGKKAKRATKKRAPKKKAAPARKKPASKAPRTAAKPGGPVTLGQAKALAQARLPESRAHRKTAAAVQAATPAAVAHARKKLQARTRAENERRIREYKETMTIMKQRGVKGLPLAASTEGIRRLTEASAPSAQPLQILAQGDSWFDYPVPLFGGGVVPRLEKLLGVPILNLAKAGDEVRVMLGVEEREMLAKQLGGGSPAGGAWDVLLFSGGGNDIVGNPMALWVQDFNGSVAPASLIHKVRFEAALAIVMAGYEDLIQLRNTLSPGTHLIFHAYDFAIPDGRGVCNIGPWLRPTFNLRRFPTQAPAFEVVKAMLQQFAAALQALVASHPGVTLLETQGTLPPQASSWHNELHPSKTGFDKIAAIFHASLKSLFPSRVLT